MDILRINDKNLGTVHTKLIMWKQLQDAKPSGAVILQLLYVLYKCTVQSNVQYLWKRGHNFI
jgi:hypothetical protein